MLLALLIAGLSFWTTLDRIKTTESIYPRYVIENVQEFGKNTGHGNVIALSPYLHTCDFSSGDAFYNMLHYYFSLAKRKKMFLDSTIIILPEYIGTWLVAANEKKSIFSDTAVEDAMQTIMFSNPVKFCRAYFQSNSKDKTKEAIFRMKSKKMLEVYQTTFSALSKEFKMTIVAGSIVLPDPTVKNGKIELNPTGKLYNVSAVFDVSGKVLSPLTKKIFLIEEEKTFTSRALQNTIPVYKTTAGNLAVLICADAWYPQNYRLLKNGKAEIIAVPSFVTGKNAFEQKWQGYNGAPTPSDVDKEDVGKLNEREAWMKYAMARSVNMKTTVSTFLRGDLWNLSSDGHTLIRMNNLMIETKDIQHKTGSLINVWLE